MQALAGFLFRAAHGDELSRINLISINRTALPQGLVTEVSCDHPVDLYDLTHREIAPIEDKVLTALLDGENRKFKRYHYFLDDVLGLLRTVRDAGLLRDDYAAIAKTLLGD